MTKILTHYREKWLKNRLLRRMVLLFSVFGPATITAMADNDAGGVATYSFAGATLGYPILFLLFFITILLAVTQEMGMRLTLVTRRGLADLIREKFGVRVSVFIFFGLLIANLGTVTVELVAVKTTSYILGLSPWIFVVGMLILAFLFITRGNYKQTQNIMLVVSLFYVVYIISAIKAKPDWGLALSNLLYPHGVEWTQAYIRNYLVIGMGVIGTTITPWGQFFLSSFAFDKKMDANTIKLSQIETYIGAFLTDFFSFFMITATAATLYVNGIILESGEQAALAIQPFAGQMAGSLFAFGLLAAAFMGLIIVPLSTAYAFSEFFGLSGSLDTEFNQGKTFYVLFMAQLLVAAILILIPGISLFQMAIATQSINALVLPFVFYFLIKLTNNRKLMGIHANNGFQKYFSTIFSIVILIASFVAVLAMVFRW